LKLISLLILQGNNLRPILGSQKLYYFKNSWSLYLVYWSYWFFPHWDPLRVRLSPRNYWVGGLGRLRFGINFNSGVLGDFWDLFRWPSRGPFHSGIPGDYFFPFYSKALKPFFLRKAFPFSTWGPISLVGYPRPKIFNFLEALEVNPLAPMGPFWEANPRVPKPRLGPQLIQVINQPKVGLQI